MFISNSLPQQVWGQSPTPRSQSEGEFLGHQKPKRLQWDLVEGKQNKVLSQAFNWLGRNLQKSVFNEWLRIRGKPDLGPKIRPIVQRQNAHHCHQTGRSEARNHHCGNILADGQDVCQQHQDIEHFGKHFGARITWRLRRRPTIVKCLYSSFRR